MCEEPKIVVKLSNIPTSTVFSAQKFTLRISLTNKYFQYYFTVDWQSQKNMKWSVNTKIDYWKCSRDLEGCKVKIKPILINSSKNNTSSVKKQMASAESSAVKWNEIKTDLSLKERWSLNNKKLFQKDISVLILFSSLKKVKVLTALMNLFYFALAMDWMIT